MRAPMHHATGHKIGSTEASRNAPSLAPRVTLPRVSQLSLVLSATLTHAYTGTCAKTRPRIACADATQAAEHVCAPLWKPAVGCYSIDVWCECVDDRAFTCWPQTSTATPMHSRQQG
jgi:hypothetical protein